MFKSTFTRSSVLVSSIGLALGLAAQMAEAAPQLPITKPPVVSGGNPNTGPANDPSASQGQWFQNVVGFNGNEPILGNTLTNRDLEFYDNRTGDGGGSSSTDAIAGRILTNSLTYDGNGLVTGFTIRATITNDFPPQGPWLDGTNSHGETLHYPDPVGKGHDLKLTAEFADDGVRGNFSSTSPANVGPESNIFAKNYDELAWYSYTTTGAFQVPTWDFGTLAVGQSVSRDLEFGLYTSVSQASIQFLIDANDIFLNRTTDLKIGDYFEKGTNGNVANVSYEGLAVDDRSAYPTGILNRAGNVSVFASVIPEPASLSLMLAGFAGLAAAGRRKKA